MIDAPDMPRGQPLRDVYTVSRLNTEVRAVLEREFPPLWVEGEISNLAQPRSGHLYFSLKDAESQVRCAMFRQRNRLLDFTPADGTHVMVHARAGLYPARGEFQLVVDYMEEAGEGALRRAFEALKRRLAAEGLFDAASQRALPALPRRLGVVTSPTGAAIRDVLSVLRRRFPGLPVLVYPVPVQGEEAAPAIVRALELAGRHQACDVLILARGGGSLEDLWAFNEEPVARAIRACPIPVITGIGHEVDFTIADLAADRRAPTPSAAAELVTPDREELRGRVRALGERLVARCRADLRQRRQGLKWLAQRVVHPRRRLEDLSQRVDGLAGRVVRAARALTTARHSMLASTTGRLQRFHPQARLTGAGEELRALTARLGASAVLDLERRRARVALLTRTLTSLGPRGTLERGYAIVTRTSDGTVVRDAATLGPGEHTRTLLGRGSLLSTVDRILDEPDD